jgi:hypothetical protein
VSNVIIARQLIRSKPLVQWAGAAQPNARPFPSIGCEEGYALPLKSSLKSRHRGCGCGRFAIGFSSSDGFDRQPRPLGESGLRQTEEPLCRGGRLVRSQAEAQSSRPSAHVGWLVHHGACALSVFASKQEQG